MEQTSVGSEWFFLAVMGQVGASNSGEGSAYVDLEVVASVIAGECTEGEEMYWGCDNCSCGLYGSCS